MADRADALWGDLEAHYDEPWRYYHDLGHVAFCLEEFDRIRTLLSEPDDVEAALWFHDAIYRPGARDNEAESARYFRSCVASFTESAVLDSVTAMILATTHLESQAARDTQYACDIDLASLGTPWESYMEDSRNLRAESPLADTEFVHRQRQYLEALLARQRIFMTDFFQRRYEVNARDNISRFLELLSADPKWYLS